MCIQCELNVNRREYYKAETDVYICKQQKENGIYCKHEKYLRLQYYWNKKDIDSCEQLGRFTTRT